MSSSFSLDPFSRRSTSRRRFLAGSAALGLWAWGPGFLSARAAPAHYRVAVIGHTGHGDYGHGLDVVWRETPGTQIVAVADANEKGLTAAVQRLGRPKGYLDYRKMLDEVKPDLLSICPRWLDQHHDMVVAAAERGVRGIYLEKPLCRTLAEADAMIAACDKHHVKLAVAHQTRYSPKLPVVQELIRSGKLGQLLEIRTRGKEDQRGGGEDLWVLGCHMFNLMCFFGGRPLWCFGTVEQQGRPIRAADVQPGAEGIGPLAGDKVHAYYRLAVGAAGHFDSVRRAGGNPSRYGIQIIGSEGIVQSFDTGHLPVMHFLPDSTWGSARAGKKWLPISSAGVDRPEPLDNRGLHGGNLLAVKDLIEAVERDRPPLCSIHDARLTVEMIAAVIESQCRGRPVSFPLVNRNNPLTTMS